jgi:acetolactate synthase-1/2/3 large subunit
MLSSSVPLEPERVFAELDACLPLDARLVCDIGNAMAYVAHYLRLRGSQQLLIPLGFACMGQAAGIALGAAHADPQRPVIALIGDAAFAMGGFEVHTAVEYPRQHVGSLGPVFIVLNNSGNGMVEAGVRAQFGRDSAIDTGRYRTPLNIRQIARGLGARAIRVREPGELASALAWALLPDAGPSVIEVVLARDAQPPMGSRIDTLIGFGKARAQTP